MGAIQGAINKGLSTVAGAAAAINSVEGKKLESEISKETAKFEENAVVEKQTQQGVIKEAQTKADEANKAKESYKGDKRKKEYKGLKAQAIDAEKNLQGQKDAMENLLGAQELKRAQLGTKLADIRGTALSGIPGKIAALKKLREGNK